MADPIGATYTLNISQMRKAIEEANRLIKNNESAWLSNASTMGDWTKSEEGLSGRLETLNKNIKEQEKVIADLSTQHKRLNEVYEQNNINIATYKDEINKLVKRKEVLIKQYGAESKEVSELDKELNELQTSLKDVVKNQNDTEKALNYCNTEIIKNSKNLQNSRKEYDKVQKSLDGFNKETEDAGNESKKASKQIDKLDDSARDLDGGFSIAKGAIAGFIANGLTALVSAVGGAISSLVGLTESTREYRTMLANLSTIADQVGASGDYVIDKWMDVNSVLGDEQAAVEGMNNLLSAGYTAEKELDAITKALEGASLQWKDTLKFEGLADSLQEWIGSGGESLTGNFAELLERLGYNLEDVTAQTKGMTDAQRRNWAITQLNKNGLADVSDAYREANKDLIAYNKANADLVNAQSLIGEMMQPLVTTVKQSAADILYSFVDMANGVEGAGDQLLYNIGYLAGSIYKSVQGAIQTLLPLVKSLIPQIINFITTNLPSMLEQGVAIISNIINGIAQSIPLVTGQISTMLSDIILMITDNAPALLNSALNLFGQIVLAIPQMIIDLTATLPTIIDSIMDGLFNGEQSVFNTALDLLMNIVEAIPPMVADLVNNLPAIIDSITNSLSEAIPKVFDGAIALFNKIVDAIPEVITSLVASLPDIITSIINFMSQNGGKIFEGAGKLLLNIVKAIPGLIVELVKALPSIITAIVNGLLDGVGSLIQTGYDLIAGLVEGLFSFDIWGSIKKLGSSIVNGFKSFFGIHSPARETNEEIGQPIAQGIAEGIVEATDEVTEVAEEASEEILDSFAEGWNDAINGTTKELASSTEKLVKDVGKSVKSTAENVGETVAETITESTTEAVKKESKDYSGDISSALTSIFDGDYSSLADTAISALSKSGTVASIFGGIFGFIKNILTDEDGELQGSMTELATALVDGLMNAFNMLVQNLPSILNGAIEFMKSFAIALIRAIPEIVKQLPKIISTIVDSLLTDGIPALFEVGAELVKGLIEGMFSINLWDVVKGVGNGIVNGFKRLFGIRSPSKVMADEIGKNLALGIEEGITDNIKGVNTALRNGVDTSFRVDGMKPNYVTVNQTNHYSQAHSRYELYKSKRDTANAVKLAMQGV